MEIESRYGKDGSYFSLKSTYLSIRCAQYNLDEIFPLPLYPVRSTLIPKSGRGEKRSSVRHHCSCRLVRRKSLACEEEVICW